MKDSPLIPSTPDLQVGRAPTSNQAASVLLVSRTSPNSRGRSPTLDNVVAKSEYFHSSIYGLSEGGDAYGFPSVALGRSSLWAYSSLPLRCRASHLASQLRLAANAVVRVVLGTHHIASVAQSCMAVMLPAALTLPSMNGAWEGPTFVTTHTTTLDVMWIKRTSSVSIPTTTSAVSQPTNTTELR